MGNNPLKRLFVGFDHRGIALEIIAIEDNDDDRMVVIHAMKIRKQFFSFIERGCRMNYAEINADDEVASVVSAVEHGAYRAASKQDSMAVRLAALSEIVREMQFAVHNNMELAEA